jgi:predicted PurR-regulated permease PerM
MTLGILMWLIFIFIGSIFLLADAQGTLLEPVLSLFATQRRARLRAMLDELGPNLRRWFLGTLLSMGIVFCTSLCGYLLIGLSLAVPLAIVAALCEIVPTVGPAVSAGIACVFAAATGTYTTVMGVLCVYGAVQMSEDYIVLPLIMRNAVRIAPVVTLFTVVLWGEIFGVPGLMLAIPINLTLWHAAKHFIAPQKPVSASAPI